jgi:plasmid stability protein
MFFHMKTTLIIPDQIIRELKRRAAQRGETLSAIVAETLRQGLRGPTAGSAVSPLPVHRMGNPKVDVADRDALYRAMEGG